MDWNQVFTIIGVVVALFAIMIALFIGGFLYLSSKIDSGFKDLSTKIQQNREDLLVVKCILDPTKYHHFPEDQKVEES